MTSSNPAPAGATQPGAWGAGAPTERRLQGIALFSVLAALMLTLLLEALDQTVVGTALPKIIAELNGFSLYTWVATAYLIASALVIPIVGKLSDQFGRKGFFIVGVVIFLLGSALSGAAQTIQALIAFRALQGLGAGIGISLVFTVVGDIFPPAERAKWQGIFGAVYGISSVFGPTLGGFLSDHGPLVGTFITDQSRWRWVFYVNIPIGLIALAALIVYLPTNLSARTSQYRGWAAIRRIDFAGAVVASAATICLLLGLTWGGQDYPWGSAQVIGALAVAAVLFGAFYFVERRAVEPVLPFSLFKNRVFTSVCLLSLGVGATILSLAIYLPLFMQGVLGESATNSGEVITPLTVSIVIGSVASGFLVARSGRYQWLTIIGAALITHRHVPALAHERLDGDPDGGDLHGAGGPRPGHVLLDPDAGGAELDPAHDDGRRHRRDALPATGGEHARASPSSARWSTTRSPATSCCRRARSSSRPRGWRRRRTRRCSPARTRRRR